jgi:hypothetical protein
MPTTMTKSQFARACNVDKARVTQWRKAGQISGAAFVGEGRFARIDPTIALKQLKLRLSTNERCGLNGLNTRLDWLPAVADDDDDDGLAEVKRHRGIMVDLADVESEIDLMIWVATDFTVQKALKPHPEALAAYMAARPELAAIKRVRPRRNTVSCHAGLTPHRSGTSRSP